VECLAWKNQAALFRKQNAALAQLQIFCGHFQRCGFNHTMVCVATELVQRAQIMAVLLVSY